MTSPAPRALTARPSRIPSAGPYVSRFIEAFCVHGEGDYYGQPFRLRPWQKSIINQAFELVFDERARRWRRKRRRVLIGLPSGSGKTELLAGIGLYMLCSGAVFRRSPFPGIGHASPDIPIAAAAKDQAGLLFGAAKIMCEESPALARITEVGSDTITLRGAPGRMYKVTAADGTNDGKRPSTLLCDELHEWSETRNTFAVLSKGTAKRADSLQVYITTAGYNLDTICGRLYEYGKRVNAGEVKDDGFLMIWRGAEEGADPDDPETWLRAHPAAGDFISLEALEDKHNELPPALFSRYFLNLWTDAESSWLPRGAWAACRLEDVPTPGPWLTIAPGPELSDADAEDLVSAMREEIRTRAGALGFRPDLPVFVGWDASTKYDSTAVVVIQHVEPEDEADGEPRILVLSRVWERPLSRDGRAVEGWTIPIEEVKAFLWAIAGEFTVGAAEADPAFISWELAKLRDRGFPVREFQQQGIKMAHGSQALYEAVVSGRIGHDGDPVLARHIKAAVARQSRQGAAAWRLVKGAEGNKMDATIALAMALWSLQHPTPEETKKTKKAPNMHGLEDEVEELEETS